MILNSLKFPFYKIPFMENLKNKTKNNFEIVITRYNEDISWSDNYINYRTVYNKGNEDVLYEYIKRDNIGRDGETLLYHIINNYNNLADITFFCQGAINDRDDQIISLENWEKYIKFEENHLYAFCNRTDLPHKDEFFLNCPITFGDIYYKIFGEKYQQNFQWVPGMWISVHKNIIKSVPLEIYKKMYNLFYEYKFENDPTHRILAVHIERFLYHVFSMFSVNNQISLNSNINYENIIIIPYRNRESQLNYFIKNVVPLIKKFLLNAKIIIIEQNQDKLFNRGLLINIGFKLYKNKTKYFIQHDIDLIPKIKTIKEYYNKNIDKNEVLAILTSPCNTYGGIVKISNENIHKINGYPNDIWGWGNEDKALQNRGEFNNLKKTTVFIRNNKTGEDEYFKFFDDIDDRDTKNININHKKHYCDFKNLTKLEKTNMINNNGLNTLNYKIIENIYIDSIVELIKVAI